MQQAVDQAAAAGATVYVPAGTYPCRDPIRLADGVRVRGEGSGSWLKGQLLFASGNRIESLKIGDLGTSAVANLPGASGTTFTGCRLHGGGSTEGLDSSVLYLGGSCGNVSDVVFEACEIERTSYVPPADIDAFARNVGNTITIHEFTHLADTAHVEGITFRDCHLGASNGRDKGALRMMLEAYSWDDDTGVVHHDWSDLTLDGCTIEASDTTGLDFSDGPWTASRRSADGVLITGCTFLGARKDETWGHGGLPIVYECPTGMVIRDNTFYASPQEAIGGSKSGDDRDNDPALLIEGNTFDMTRSPDGLIHERNEAIISLVGHRSRVVGNTFLYEAGMGVLIKSGSGDTVFSTTSNVIEGNRFTDTRESDGEPTIVLTDEFGLGCHDNRVTANKIINRARVPPASIRATTGDGANYATDNVIDCGSSPPFVVVSGTLVRDGNRIVGHR